MSDEEAVWAVTTDGGLLRQLFGYYPTLHDSVIVSVEIFRASDRIELTVDYSDMAEEDDRELLSARIRFEWTGIELFDFPLGFEDLYGISFSKSGDKIRTDLEMWPGIFGAVISETVEAVLLQLDPGEPDISPILRYR